MEKAERKLWQPSLEFQKNSNLYHFMEWLKANKGLTFQDYQQLWTWSVEEFESFWKSLLEYFDVLYNGHFDNILSQREMPGVRWFEGIRLNYAEHVFRNATDRYPAIISISEGRESQTMTWAELRRQVAVLQLFLKKTGIKKGDCMVGYLPNITQATVSLLAANSIGAIWSSCSPDFGTQAVLDRFSQIKPAVLIAVDGYTYGGKFFDKGSVVEEIVQGISSIKKVIVITQSLSSFNPQFEEWNTVIDGPSATLAFERTDFNHPIWVLYSSGTTGLPKAITHSQGGILLEQLKYLTFHQDVHPGERCFWFTTTGWMMWNYLHGCLLCGGTMVLYDGSPAHKDMKTLWRLIGEIGIHHFGVSAGFILSSMKADVHPVHDFNLTTLRSIGSTGSTLPPEGFDWIYQSVKNDVWLTSMSGGTDICSAFVGGNPLLAVYAGEIQCTALGCKLEVWNEEGRRVEHEEGEMIITQPMPCMPVFFWNDPDLSRYRESYFDQFPGVWRHGDWVKITNRNGIIIFGRSDATLNRGGVRIGTSEIYRALDQVVEVKDSLILCIEKKGGEFYMPLFVMMNPGKILDADVKKKINLVLRTHYSPRHVPDEIIEVTDIPYTVSGKKMETPVKKIMMGKDPNLVVNFGALRNPGSIRFFVDFAKEKLLSP